MPTYRTKDSQGNIYEINVRDKNLLIQVYQSIDDIASSPKWGFFWKEKYKIKPMSNFSNNRKFLWIGEERRWVYTDMSKIDITITNETIEKFLELGLTYVKSQQTRKSKLLEDITPKEVRTLLEVFQCFDYF
jgi:hypothetical protein